MAGRSLFERLRAAATPGSHPFEERAGDLQNSVRANLQNLFNSWAGHAPAQMDLGLPSPSDIAYRYPDSIPEVRRAIENNIEKYEPRLKNVRVFHVESEGESLVLGFQIEAFTTEGEPFSFEATVDHTGEVSWRGDPAGRTEREVGTLFSKHYQDELQFLREMGREFSRAHPEAAPFLSGPGGDPDVERLIEGFAFLTARVREKLDDELPEVIHSLLEVFFPHYLRPIPAMSIVAFDPMKGDAVTNIPRGTELESIEVKGDVCRFRTVFPTDVLPLTLTRCTLNPGPPDFLTLGFDVNPGASMQKMGLNTLRLHLAGESAVGRGLYLSLTRNLKKVSVKPSASWGDAKSVNLPSADCKPVGFGKWEFLLPYPPGSFSGFRLLQEYFAFPQKFMFVDLEGLDGIGQAVRSGSFDLVLELSGIPPGMPTPTVSNVALNCTPVVNLFNHDGDPIRFDHKQAEYMIRPSGASHDHYEVYSVDKVTGISQDTGAVRAFPSLFSGSGGENEAFHRTHVRPSPLGVGTDLYIGIVDASGAETAPDIETLSIELTCTNRQLPKELGVGDIRPHKATKLKVDGYRNLIRPTVSIPPPLGADLYWRLISHLALNYQSLSTTGNLKKLLWLYNFRARVDRQAERSLELMTSSIKSISAAPVTRMFRGIPVRGVEVALELSEDEFGGEGEMALFGTVFDEFLSQYVSLNSFSRLVIRGASYGGSQEWPPRIGKRTIL